MYAIISNDWKRIEYSDEFNKRFDYFLNEALKSGEKDSGALHAEIRAKLLIDMQENSFKELHDGASVFKYDETKVHPVIEEEEYGGQSIYFEKGPQKDDKIQITHAYTYDPITGKNEGNYDAENDRYNNDVSYDDGVYAEFQIKGSRQAAEELLENIPKSERESLDRYCNFNGASLKGLKEMLSLDSEHQKVYLKIFAGTSIPKDKVYRYAKELTEKDLNAIRGLCRLARQGNYAVMESLLSNEIGAEFVDDGDFRDAAYKNPETIKLLDMLPEQKSLMKEYTDEEWDIKSRESILHMAAAGARDKGIDIIKLLPEKARHIEAGRRLKEYIEENFRNVIPYNMLEKTAREAIDVLNEHGISDDKILGTDIKDLMDSYVNEIGIAIEDKER